MYLKKPLVNSGGFSFLNNLNKGNEMPNLIQYIIQEDPSKKTLSDLFADRVIDDYKKSRSEVYRTKKSDAPKNWGKKTEAHLNEYLKKDKSVYPGKTTTGLLAPFKDFSRNYQQMKDDESIGNDKFFHCKANYEAAKRGEWGEFVGKAISSVREFPLGTIKHGIQDTSNDWEANRRGWRGAKAGKNLLESCSRNPRDYYK